MILLLLTGLGCIPIPHDTRFAPDTTVVLTRDGEPVRHGTGVASTVSEKIPLSVVLLSVRKNSAMSCSPSLSPA